MLVVVLYVLSFWGGGTSCPQNTTTSTMCFLTELVDEAVQLDGVPDVDDAPERVRDEGGDGDHHALVLVQVVVVGGVLLVAEVAVAVAEVVLVVVGAVVVVGVVGIGGGVKRVGCKKKRGQKERVKITSFSVEKLTLLATKKTDKNK